MSSRPALRTRPRLLVTGLVVLLLALTACGEPSTVSRSTLEQRVVDSIDGEGSEDLVIDCPGDLKAQVNASADCLVEDPEGDVTGVRFITTEVDGDDLSYETLVFLGAESVEQALLDGLAEEGTEVSAVNCSDELVGTPGSTLACTATTDAGETVVEVTATGVEGLDVQFDWEVVEESPG